MIISRDEFSRHDITSDIQLLKIMLTTVGDDGKTGVRLVEGQVEAKYDITADNRRDMALIRVVWWSKICSRCVYLNNKQPTCDQTNLLNGLQVGTRIDIKLPNIASGLLTKHQRKAATTSFEKRFSRVLQHRESVDYQSLVVRMFCQMTSCCAKRDTNEDWVFERVSELTTADQSS